MTALTLVKANDLAKHSILIYEPFSDFLRGDEAEKRFAITLLDVVRFAGHACPSMIGAFLMAQEAVQKLFPENGVCVRGDLAVDISSSATSGPTGPIANVFSYITGAWTDTGFGGLRGHFARRGLLRFQSEDAPPGGYRFTRLSTGKSLDVSYDPSQVDVALDPSLPFQTQWRAKITAILDNPQACVHSAPVPG
ncbi:MAG: hypothetical protein NDI61_11195 [Bdellovibrionaceae bacterium]|nr:hypothetical protein [Pseudobdellovibrionaceae bacterium]